MVGGCVVFVVENVCEDGGPSRRMKYVNGRVVITPDIVRAIKSQVMDYASTNAFERAAGFKIDSISLLLSQSFRKTIDTLWLIRILTHHGK